jgi:hypothetical protein
MRIGAGISMKKLLFSSLVLVFLLGMVSCASCMDEYYKGNKKIHFYHGKKHLDVFISIIDIPSTDIKFENGRFQEMPLAEKAKDFRSVRQAMSSLGRWP